MTLHATKIGRPLAGSIALAVLLAPIAVAPSAQAVPLGSASCAGVADFGGGTGAVADPYQVSTAQHLYNSTACASGTYLTQVADIDLSGVDWTPANFSAFYEGNDKTISNLGLDLPGGADGGLFLELRGTVQNVTLQDFTISAGGNNWVGMLAGFGSTAGVVEARNVVVSGGSITGSGVNVGGLIGRVNASGLEVVDCSSSASVSSSTNLAIIGGLVGRNSGAIYGSTATGSVTATGLNSYLGGLVGDNRGPIAESRAAGLVTEDVSQAVWSTGYGGGLIGYVGSTASSVTHSSASGNVNVTGQNSYAGGLIGYQNAVGATLNTSSASGLVRNINSDSAAEPYGVGGLVGSVPNRSNPGPVLQDVYATGNVSIESSSSAATAGGLIGNLMFNDVNSKLNISNAYSIGAVTGKGAGLFANVSAFMPKNAPANEGVTAPNAYYNGEDNAAAQRPSWGQAKTKAELRTQSTFVGWDFANTWLPPSGSGYPTLRIASASAAASASLSAAPGATANSVVAVANGANAGSATFLGKGYAITGAPDSVKLFSATDGCTSDVSAGSTCGVTVTFAPVVAGTVTATLHVYTTAGMVTTTLTGVSSSGGGGGGGGGSSSTEPTSTPSPTAPPAPSLDAVTSGAPLAPGQSRVTVGGAVAGLLARPDAANTGIDVVGVGWGLGLSGANSAGVRSPLGPDGVLRLVSGQFLHAQGVGYLSNSRVRLYLFSDAVLLGELATDAQGAFDGTVPVPAGVPIGAHTAQVNGFTVGNQMRSVSLGVEVVSPARTTSTVGSRVFFAYRSATLTPTAKRTLRSLAAQVPADATATSVVVGIVQAQAPRAGDRALARARAARVARYLTAVGLPGRVSIRTKPVNVANTAEARRVVVTVNYSR